MHGAGVPEVTLPLRREQASGGVERNVVANCGQDVVELLVLRPRVSHAVGREERQAQAPCEVRERLVAALLLPPPVALKLDVEAARKDRPESLEEAVRRIEAALLQLARDEPFRAARQRVQSLGMRGDLLERHRRFPLGFSERARRDEATEVLVAGARLDEEREARRTGGRKGRPYGTVGARRTGYGTVGAGLAPALQGHLRPDDRPDPCRFRRLVEPRRAVDAVGVDERHGGDLPPRRFLDEVLGQRGAVEKRERRCRVELGVCRFS